VFAHDHMKRSKKHF